MHAISLIYGEHVLDDLEFCRQHDEIIKRYSRGNHDIAEFARRDARSRSPGPGSLSWLDPLAEEPPPRLRGAHGFLLRLIRHYVKTGRLMRTFFPL
jgi:hypothetical protein